MFEVVLTCELEVLATVMGGGEGAKSFNLLKGGGAQTVLLCLEGGGGGKSFGPAIFPFFNTPPRN